MRWFKNIAVVLVIVLAAASASVYYWLYKSRPSGDDIVIIAPTGSDVEVLFDKYGIPHIYASSESDAYFALGYVQARDRLFQMEMTRRLVNGELAAVLGADFVKTDAFFRTLCLAEHARESSAQFLSADSLPYQRAALAYIDGVNRFVNEGNVPPEFDLLGMELRPFGPVDLYLTAEYMAFSFSMGFRTDPVMSYIHKQLGTRYFGELNASHVPGTLLNTVQQIAPVAARTNPAVYTSVAQILDNLPVPVLSGSNAWVVSPSRSTSGKVLFSNDTHIAFGQPSVWFEAHMVYPGYEFYGNHLAGFPFAVLGHSRSYAWGLTMLENDDLDFFREKVDQSDSLLYMDNGVAVPFQTDIQKIKVKDEDSRELLVRKTRRGPLVQDVMPEWKEVTDEPVSMMWTHLEFPMNLLQITYDMGRAGNMVQFKNSISQIVSPGLNILYGDSTGNIAWWTAGKFMVRSKEVDPVLISDGSDSANYPSGYSPFELNPCNENPASGYVASANQQPASFPGMPLLPGYFVPEDRAIRIEELFGRSKQFSTEDLRSFQLDTRSPVTPRVASVLVSLIGKGLESKSKVHGDVLDKLRHWKGDHGLRDIEPTVYYKWLYHVFALAMEDELGPERFRRLLSTHVIRTSTLPFCRNDSSIWWNDVRTPEVVESRTSIVEMAFDKTVRELKSQLGEDVSSWEWGRVHILEHKHPIGEKKPLNLLFNSGPFPVPGGPEVLNQMGFELNGTGMYKVKYGPAMRITLDFADPAHSTSVLPTGQSGHLMSPHYDDQAALYNAGKCRSQLMDRVDIEKEISGSIRFKRQDTK
jgi:penicillin amidase